MLASLEDAPLDDPQLVYEPKYDGIRAVVEVGPGSQVRLWSRLGNEKTQQFPEIAGAFGKWARRLKAPVVLDGEIVALASSGEPTGFQQLQGRIHLNEPAAPSRRSNPSSPSRPSTPPTRVAFIAFDLLRDGKTDFRDRPLTERRTALERLFGKTGSPQLRLSTQVRGDGRALHKEALEHGWEGLIAKQAASLYKSGKRTPDWRKLKIVHEQEFVIGGWTEPRQTRAYFGALLLGVYAPVSERHAAGSSRRATSGGLTYVGHTGTGFNERELSRVMTLLKKLETDGPPFLQRPKTNERPHWVRPELVAEIKFTEWTADGKLRHPVYLGLRDDKKPEDVVREEKPRVQRSRIEVRGSGRSMGPESGTGPGTRNRDAGTTGVIEQLDAIEHARGDGVLTLPEGTKLKVTNLGKIFWPKQKLTKGDLLRYYVRVAPFILPAVADRSLVLKRYPNGVAGKWFYQHRVEDPPPGVRTEVVSVEERRPQIVGGTLTTLLYTAQLAAISQDPWFSRVQHPEFADYVALDLDPSDDVAFTQVLDVARWIHDELDALGAVGVPKTSGASGLHVYIPLPPDTPYDAGLLFCQIVATVVAQKHPRMATIERSVRARGARVYVDYLQNVLGKTLATAYSARASDYAGVSTPLTWREIDKGVDRAEFTIQTVPARLEKIGDLWAALRKSKGVDLARVARYADRMGEGRSKRRRT
jgi:bifunctional non-homologous end joining protein LigD